MHGRIGALIELGAGFNPILTGRENMYNKGAIVCCGYFLPHTTSVNESEI